MILNLAHVEKSSIKYKLIKFPDSHTHIDFINIADVTGKEFVTIETRLSTLDDVFILLQATSAIRSVSSSIPINLFISYLICGRYDRPMHSNDSFDLKIITDLLVSQKYARIVVYEAHSLATTALLNCENLHVLDKAVGEQVMKDLKNTCLVAPDLGAVKRVEEFVKKLGVDVPIVRCHKDRNILTGQIRGLEILNPKALRDKVVIYDDLCDGGRTFIEAAKTLQIEKPNCNITLAVTHGIFSKGFDIVLEAVDRVITTNSYTDIVVPKCYDMDISVVEVI
jgi:ribose-phosphate pyrophosphokinase